MEGEYRAVVGARPGRAVVVRDEEGLLSGGGPESCKVFSAYAAERVPVGSNTGGSAAYRTHLIQVLTERNLMQLGGKMDGN